MKSLEYALRQNDKEVSMTQRENLIKKTAEESYLQTKVRAGALGRPRGMGWGGRWEGGSGWGTHVNP